MDIWVRLSTYNSAGTLRYFHVDIWWKSGELGNPQVLPVLSTWICTRGNDLVYFLVEYTWISGSD